MNLNLIKFPPWVERVMVAFMLVGIVAVFAWLGALSWWILSHLQWH